MDITDRCYFWSGKRHFQSNTTSRTAQVNKQCQLNDTGLSHWDKEKESESKTTREQQEDELGEKIQHIHSTHQFYICSTNVTIVKTNANVAYKWKTEMVNQMQTS